MTEVEQAREFVRFTQGLTTEQQAAAYLISEGRVELARLQGKIKKHKKCCLSRPIQQKDDTN